MVENAHIPQGYRLVKPGGEVAHEAVSRAPSVTDAAIAIFSARPGDKEADLRRVNEMNQAKGEAKKSGVPDGEISVAFQIGMGIGVKLKENPSLPKDQRIEVVVFTPDMEPSGNRTS